jgi:hypothetical protein
MNTIKEILASVTHNPHYLNKYITFITNCQEKNKNYIGYTEKHHICPKAQDMFPEFISFKEFPWNCVALTPRQHFIAHLLLCKTYPDVISQAHAVNLMIKLQGINISSKLYAKLRIEVAGLSKGKITVRDFKGRTSRVSTDDIRYLSGELVSACKDKVPVKDSNGNNLQVSITDSRYLSGELVHICTGKVPVRDVNGDIFQVDRTDSRYLSGELVSMHKGKVAVKDVNSNTLQVNKTDSRYLSGELIHVHKNRPANNRGLNREQVIEIKAAVISPITIITDDYVASVVKKSDIHKVGKVPIEELRYVNGRYLSYKRLIAKFYADKFSIGTSKIINVIEGKTYKEITV